MATATVLKGRESVYNHQFTSPQECRVRVNFPRTLVNPSVCVTLSETNIGPWGYFLYASGVDTAGFTLVVRVPLGEGGVQPSAPAHVVIVNWIAIGD